MSEEQINEQRNPYDAFFLELGIPEANAKIMVLSSLQRELFTTLVKSGVLNVEQVNQIFSSVAERVNRRSQEFARDTENANADAKEMSSKFAEGANSLLTNLQDSFKKSVE